MTAKLTATAADACSYQRTILDFGYGKGLRVSTRASGRLRESIEFGSMTQPSQCLSEDHRVSRQGVKLGNDIP